MTSRNPGTETDWDRSAQVCLSRPQGQKCPGVFEQTSGTNWCQPVGFEEVVECAGQLSKGCWGSLSSNAPRLL